MLLLGSYPSEVELHLQRARLASTGPVLVGGHEFYTGRLAGHRVAIGIAGPSPSVARATTAAALRHFTCVSAVVYTGTAGGKGAALLGDVVVPRRWTDDDGATFLGVDQEAYAVARRVAAGTALKSSGTVNDGPCACSGLVSELQSVPIGRAPRVRVGGAATVFGGEDLACYDQGGMLAGCEPCPPSSPLPVAPSGVLDAVPAGDVERAAADAVRAGLLVPDAATLLARGAPARSRTQASPYVAEDMQTTGSLEAARRLGVPFLAFRGVSDTEASGDAWPLVWLVYQQLAADNAALAAHAWLRAWPGT